MIVLGIDPGSHRTGWGVVWCEGSVLRHLASGILSGEGDTLSARLCAIADALDVLLARHQPEAVAVETIFHAKNSQSALLLGHARGVALLSAARAGAQVFEYTAGQIKQATVGRGRADKEQVRTMVRAILGLQGPLGLDASDALAAAICHAQLYATPTAMWLQEARRALKR